MNFDGNQQFMVKIIPDGSLGAAWRRRWALFGTLGLTIDKCVLSLLGQVSWATAKTFEFGDAWIPQPGHEIGCRQRTAVHTK